jgi:arylsulfatase A-like enzyme
MVFQKKVRQTFRIAGACGFSAVTAVAGAEKKSQGADRPNILLILADDLGYGDIGVHGCKDILTPVIDGLARDGMLFTDAYVTHSTCGPSRAGLMTGRHPMRFGFSTNPDYIIPNQPEAPLGLPPSEITMAQVLKGAGYRTGLVGKWHLGHSKSLHPLKFGFDSFYGILGAQNWYFDVNASSGTFKGVLRNYDFVKEPEYLTYGFAREAVDFVTADDARPWFLYLAFTAVHTPLMADTWKQGDPLTNQGPSKIPAENRLVYKNMLEAMDASIGRVLTSLEQTGQAKNTLVVFLSDNGGTKNSGAYNNGPLRDWKGSLFEGGVRVPCMARWPGVIPPGTRSSQVISSLDLLPTFADMAGARLPTDRTLDGVSLVPLFEQQMLPDGVRTLFWRDGRDVLAVRHGNWKAFLDKNGKVMLYDLGKDVSEKADLSAGFPEIAFELRKKMELWQQQLPPDLWIRVDDWDGWRKQMGNFDWDE